MFDSQITDVMDKVDDLRNTKDDHMQIPRDEANLLAQLIRIGRCVSVCEIGVSYGFSTLHQAAAVKDNGGHLHGIDIRPHKIEAATEHLSQAGLDDVVTLHLGDGREVLKTLTPDRPFDFCFIDAVKEQSMAYLHALVPLLADRAMLVTDNTHHPDPERLKEFVAHLRSLENTHSCGVPVGNGFELTIWRKQ